MVKCQELCGQVREAPSINETSETSTARRVHQLTKISCRYITSDSFKTKTYFFSLKSWWGFPVFFFIVHAQYGKCMHYIIMINLWQNDGCNGDVLHLAGHFPTLYAYIVILKTRRSWMFFDYYFWQWSRP